jgi:chromosome segregation ATPase
MSIYAREHSLDHPDIELNNFRYSGFQKSDKLMNSGVALE